MCTMNSVGLHNSDKGSEEFVRISGSLAYKKAPVNCFDLGEWKRMEQYRIRDVKMVTESRSSQIVLNFQIF